MADNRILYADDCLNVLNDEAAIPNGSVDLIYLDPPFNSKSEYNLPFKGKYKSARPVEAFKDTWEWEGAEDDLLREFKKGPSTRIIADVVEVATRLETVNTKYRLDAYLINMAQRLLPMPRVLKSTGSIYLHCDPNASHYLKVIMDAIFGKANFQNEIVWRRTISHGNAKRWAPLHDTILFYSRSDKFVWNRATRPYAKQHVEGNFVRVGDEYFTNYYGNVLTGSGIRNGESGQPWLGIDPSAKNRHWAIPGKLWEDSGLNGEGLSQRQKLEALLDAGLIEYDEGKAWPMYRRRIHPTDGMAIGDIWAYQPYTDGVLYGTEEGIDADVSWIKPRSAERLGYDTQKPLGLLGRIVSASSNPGDMVLDPFCGCGTAIHAAESLGRRWIGIDISAFATGLIRNRILAASKRKALNVKANEVRMAGVPVTAAMARELADHDKFEFEKWACGHIGAEGLFHAPGTKGPDGGADGVLKFFPMHWNEKPKPRYAVVQVKGGKVTPDSVGRLFNTVTKLGADAGVFVCFADQMRTVENERIRTEFRDVAGSYPVIQGLSVEDMLSGKQPHLPNLLQRAA